MAREIFRRLTANDHNMATEQILFPLKSQLAWLPVYQLKCQNQFLLIVVEVKCIHYALNMLVLCTICKS